MTVDISQDVVERVWARMVTMRVLEERLADAARDGEIHGEMHVALGQEAVAAALAEFLVDGDAVTSTHRPHLHALAAGVDPVQMVAEILERDGLNGGKGGHMHLFDAERLFMCTGIVGANAPIALGYALSRTLLRPGERLISVCALGDGSMNQGAVLESLNLAAIRSLPVLFVVEDNGYGISVPSHRASAGRFVDRASAFGITGVHVDGGDVAALLDVLGEAVHHIRETGGPYLVVADVYRFSGHYEGDLDLYRSAAEKEEARSRQRDPVTRTEDLLVVMGTDPARLGALREESTTAVDSWMRLARETPWPSPSSAHTGELVG